MARFDSPMSMQRDQVRSLLAARPFQPFVVHLVDGRQFEVPHPEFAWLTPNGRSLFVSDERSRVDRIDTALVTSLSDPRSE